jgi:hypothetical protein
MIYTYTPEQITEIVRLHGLWWRDEAGGVRANLRGANLSDALQRIVVIHGSRNVIVAIDGDVRIGCERHVIAEWLEQFEAIGQKQGYTPEQIAEYGLHLRHIAAVLALGWPAGAKAGIGEEAQHG